MQHSKTKHIALHYHLIKDHVEDGNIEVHFVKTTDQLANILTKPLDEKTFLKTLASLGMIYVNVVPNGTSL